MVYDISPNGCDVVIYVLLNVSVNILNKEGSVLYKILFYYIKLTFTVMFSIEPQLKYTKFEESPQLFACKIYILLINWYI